MMTEQKENTGDTTEETKPETKAEKLIRESNEATDRREAANKKTEELIERQEAANVQATLGGKADAGQEPQEPKEETPKEYKDRVMAGKL